MSSVDPIITWSMLLDACYMIAAVTVVVCFGWLLSKAIEKDNR